MSEGRRKTSLVLADQMLVSGANFVSGLILARLLGPSGYGQFSLANGVILFVSGVQIALIVSPMMVKGAHLPPGERRDYFAATHAQQIIFSAFAALLLMAGIVAVGQLVPAWRLDELLWPLVFAMLGFTLQDFFRRYCFVSERTSVALTSDLVSHGLKLALFIAVGVFAQMGAGTAFWLMGLAFATGILVSLLFGEGLKVWNRPSSESLARVNAEHWDFGKWLLANSIVYWGSSQFVIYMVGGMMSAAAVGNMVAALNLVGAANILFLALENLVPSRAARMYAQRGEPGLNRYLRRVSVLGGFGTLAIALVAGIWSEFWLKLFYGIAYEGYGWIVVWWGIYYVMGFFQRPLSAGLRVVGYTRGLFMSSVGGTLVAAALSYPMIRWAGISGAMFTLCCVQVAVVLTSWAAYRGALRRLPADGAA